eukprot:gene9076-6369_t
MYDIHHYYFILFFVFFSPCCKKDLGHKAFYFGKNPFDLDSFIRNEIIDDSSAFLYNLFPLFGSRNVQTKIYKVVLINALLFRYYQQERCSPQRYAQMRKSTLISFQCINYLVFFCVVGLNIACIGYGVPAGEAAKISLVETDATLSGAVHLVVGAGTIGTYKAQGTAVGQYLYFAEFSSLWIAQQYNITSSWGVSVLDGAGTLNDLFEDISCEGAKHQSQIFRIQPDGTVIVQFPAYQTIGRVCSSIDGRFYSPINITFEVVDIRLLGFAEPFRGSTAFSAEWSAPRFVSEVDVEKDSSLVFKDAGFAVGSSGALQLVAKSSYYDTQGSTEGDEDLFRRQVRISSIRFSLTADCSSSPASLLPPDNMIERIEDADILYFHFADIVVSENNFFKKLSSDGFLQLMSSTLSLPGTFFVCVAVQKSPLSLPIDGNWSNIEKRIAAQSSLSSGMKEQLFFSLVPGLTGYLKPPVVTPRGMWLIPPRSSKSRVMIDSFEKSFRPQRSLVRLGNNGAKEEFECGLEVRVPLLSNPVVLIDAKEVLPEGMVISLVGNKKDCGNNLAKHPHLFSISRLDVQRFSLNDFESISFFEVDGKKIELINENTTETRWFVCLSPSAYLRSWSLPAWSIVVYRDSLFVEYQDIYISESFCGPMTIPTLNTSLWSEDAIAGANFVFAQNSSCATETNDVMKIIGENQLLVHSAVVPMHGRTYCLCVSPAGSETFLPTGVRVHVDSFSLIQIGPATAKDPFLDLVVPSPWIALPVRGVGISSSTTPFLSSSSCTSSSIADSLFNLTIVPDGKNDESGFLLLPRIDDIQAKKVFSTKQAARYLCVSVFQRVMDTPFMFRPVLKRVTSIMNSEEDVSLFKASGIVVSTASVAPVIVYGSSISLQVRGYDLEGMELRPAWNCSDASTLLWNESMTLTQVSPSMTRVSQMCDNSLACEDTWFGYLSPLQTTERYDVTISNEPEWCSRFPGAAGTWISTGVPYRLIYPQFTGFLTNTNALEHEAHLSQDKRWHFLRLTGPAIRVLSANPSAHYKILLVRTDQECYKQDERPSAIMADNGEFVVDVEKFKTPGELKLCYTAGEDSDKRKSYIEVPTSVVRIVVEDSYLPLITKLDHKTVIRVEKESPSVLLVSGVGITDQTVVQLVPKNASCYALGTFTKGIESAASLIKRCKYFTNSSTCSESDPYEVFFSTAFLQPLNTGQMHKLCFQALPDSSWLPSPVSVEVTMGKKNSSQKNYWSRNDIKHLHIFSESTKTMATTFDHSTLIVLSSNTVFSLWCGSTETNELTICSNNLRVSLIPLECGNVTNCTLADDYLAQIWGPFDIVNGLIAIPKAGVQSRWWRLAVETKHGAWEGVLENIRFFSPDESSGLGFSTAPDFPAPLNQTSIEYQLKLKMNTAVVAYLSGFDIQSGMKLRFGALCDEDVTHEDMIAAGVDKSNVSYLVEYRQKLNNSMLYTQPISVINSLGALFFPEEYTSKQQQPTPVCLSKDGGQKYEKTHLTLKVHLGDDSTAFTTSAKLSRIIYVLRGSNGIVKFNEINPELWRLFRSGASFALASSCGDAIPDNALLSRTANGVYVPAVVTSEPSRGSPLRFCSKLPLEVSWFDTSVLLYVVNSRLVLSSPSLEGLNHFLAMSDTVDVLHINMTQESPTSCIGSSEEAELMCSLDNNPLLRRGIRIGFTHTSCDSFDSMDNDGTITRPAWLSNSTESYNWRGVVPIPYLPSVPLENGVPGSMCVSFNGDFFFSTEIQYYTSGFESKLLFSSEDQAIESYSNKVQAAEGVQQLSGRAVDSRCLKAGFLDLICHELTSQLWHGFLNTIGWIQSGRWSVAASLNSGTIPIYFLGRTGNRAINTGTALEVTEPQINCFRWRAENRVFVQQSDSGRLSHIASDCANSLSVGSAVRLVPFTTQLDACDGSNNYPSLDLRITEPARWAVVREPLVALMWPPMLRYLPNGVFTLCFGNNQSSQSKKSALTVEVGLEEAITAVGGQTSGDVEVFQGANVKLLLQGKAVEVGQPFLITFAPVVPTEFQLHDGERWMWNHGCHDIPFTRASDGSSLLSGQQPLSGTNALLRSPIARVNDGWLTVPASSVQHTSPYESYLFCFSLNDGVTFERVNEIQLRVIPPTLTGVLIGHKDSTSLFTLPSLTSSNALSVIRLASFDSKDVAQTVAPWGYVENSRNILMVHPPLYFASSLSGFIGNGLGPTRGRNMSWTSSVESTPTLAAAVALLRSSVSGSVCNRYEIDFEIRGFIESDFATQQIGGNNELLQMNPVMKNAQWVDNTNALRQQDTWEAIIACLSLDGRYYYSANFNALNKDPKRVAVGDSISPLILVPESSTSGNTLAREVALLVTLIGRGMRCDDAFSPDSAAWLHEKLSHTVGVDPSIIVTEVQKIGCVASLYQDDDLGLSSLLPMFVLSVTISADTVTFDDNLHKPVPILLLDVADAVSQPSLFELVYSSEDTQLGPIAIDFFFSNGELIHTVDGSNTQESEWIAALLSIPRDGASAAENNIVSAPGSSPLPWYVMLLVILFPLVLILGSLALYHKYLATSTAGLKENYEFILRLSLLRDFASLFSFDCLVTLLIFDYPFFLRHAASIVFTVVNYFFLCDEVYKCV